MSRQNQIENMSQRVKNPSFSRVRVSGIEAPGDRVTQNASFSDQSVHESFLFNDMDSINQSTIISNSSFNVYDYTNKKSHPRVPPRYYVDREHVHLPPIDRRRRDSGVHHYIQSESRPDYVYHSQFVPQRYRSLNHYRHGETHDPRWWYMPINSVHGPKSRRWIDHRQHYYSPPKWYQLPDRR